MPDPWFAILAADMVGSSRLMAEAEEDVVVRLADLHTSIGDMIARNGGRMISMAGDGFKAAFPGAVEAMTSAWDIQKLVRARNAGVPLSRQMLYRIGIAGGPAEERHGELFGPCVAIASGLETLAPPGGVVLSKDIHDQLVTERLFKFEPIGEHRLRGVKAEVTAFALVQPALPVSTPASTPDTIAAATSPVSAAPTQGTRDWSELQRAAGLIVAAGAGAVALFYAFNRVVPAPPTTQTAGTSAPSAVRAQSPSPQAAAPTNIAATSAAPSVPGPAATMTAPPPSLSDTPLAPKADGAVQVPAPSPAVTAPGVAATAAAPPALPVPQALPQPAPPAVAAAAPPPRTATDPTLLSNLEECFGANAEPALRACRDLLQMRDLGPAKGRDGEIQGRLGTLLREAGRHDEAVTMLDAGLRSAPSAAIAVQLGIAHFARGRLAEAEAAFSQAISLDMRDGDAYNNRAWTRFKRGQNREALVDSVEAQKRAPDKSYVWDTSGHIEEALGNKQAAIDAFRKAIVLEPGKPASLAGLKRLGAAPSP